MSNQPVTQSELQEMFNQFLVLFEKMLSEKLAAQKSLDWVRPKVAANLMNVSQGTLKKRQLQHSIPYSDLNPGIYYKIDDLNNLFERNRVEPINQDNWLDDISKKI